MRNQEVIEKAEMTLASLKSGGMMNPTQANAFIRMVQDTPTILRVALTKDQKSVPSISTVNLSTKEVIAEVNITYDTLENNIEQEVAYRCDLYQFILIESNLKDLQPYSRI